MHYFILLVVLCGLQLTSGLLTNSSAIDVLKSIYTATAGATWNYEKMAACSTVPPALGNGVHWNFTKVAGSYVHDPCSTTTSSSHFAGVGCVCGATSCNITELQIPCANLNGALPSSIGLLTGLVFLDMRSNSLSGAIPPQIGNLKSLKTLDLHSNSLASSIPAEIGTLPALVTCNLYSNNLSGAIPSSLGGLTNLVTLNLHLNDLTSSIPAALGSLVKLQYLGLFSNSLTGILPPLLGQMAALTNMLVCCNSLSGAIPQELGDLKLLRYLDLSSNQLVSSIPGTLGGLSNLQYFYLKQNTLNGPIPATFGGLKKVITLDLSSNSLSSAIPPQLGLLQAVTSILLSGNALDGEFPKHLSNCSKLQILDLSQNLLSGSLPVNVTQIASLRSLILSDNSLTGSIPAAIGALTNLRVLVLSRNKMSGAIPYQIHSCTDLGSLVLSNNRFQGPLPSQLGELGQLEYLNLYDNYFSGQLPAELDRAISLQYLELYSNDFSGTIPASFESLTKLVSLQLYDNNLVGPIPANAGRWVRMQNLLLHENQLTGTVPAAIGTFSNLLTLSLHQNKFSGSITFINPAVQIRLKTVDLSNNHFTGTLPENLFALPALSTFTAGSNCFSGSVPDSICGAQNLTTLDITGLSSSPACSHRIWGGTTFRLAFGWDALSTENFMAGSLPSCVFTLPHITTLYGAANAFSGEIPSTLSTTLEYVDLSRNRLGGTLSFAFSAVASAEYAWSKLTVLDLSYNRVTGDLSAFYGGPFFTKAGSQLSLQTNRLSGDIPAAIASSPHLNILSGNLFDCSGSREDLPAADPSHLSYQCGSNSFLAIFYKTGIYLIVIGGCLLMLKYNSRLKSHYEEFCLWMALSTGTKHIACAHVSTTHIRRYASYLVEVRVLLSNLYIFFIVIAVIFSALPSDGSRTVANTYFWGSTVAYMSGSGATVLLVVLIAMLVVYMRRQMTLHTSTDTEQVAQAAAASQTGSAHASDAAPRQSMSTLLEWSLVVGRLLLLVSLLWGIAAAMAVWFVREARIGSTRYQAGIKFVFAVFLVFWCTFVAPVLFRAKWLMLCLPEKRHDFRLLSVFGHRISVLFYVNAVSALVIPVITCVVTMEECFFFAFFSHPVTTTAVTFAVSAAKNPYLQPSFPMTATATVTAPFLYSYTCSTAVIKLLVEVYQMFFVYLVARSTGHLGYLVLSVNDRRYRSLADVGLFQGWFLSTFPTSNLLFGSSYRQSLYVERGKPATPESVFPDTSIGWIAFCVPHHLLALTLLCTIGFVAPPLALLIIAELLLDTYVAQLVLGRFMLSELAVASSAPDLENLPKGIFIPNDAADADALILRDGAAGVGVGAGVGAGGFKGAYVPPTLPTAGGSGAVSARETAAAAAAAAAAAVDDLPGKYVVTRGMLETAGLDECVREAHDPWGAFAALNELETACSHSNLPANCLSLARTALVFFPSWILAFVTNDTLNSRHDPIDRLVWPSVVMLLFPFVVEMSVWLYQRIYGSGRGAGGAHGADFAAVNGGVDGATGKRRSDVTANPILRQDDPDDIL